MVIFLKDAFLAMYHYIQLIVIPVFYIPYYIALSALELLVDYHSIRYDS
jgi:hypothetical protein